MARFRAIKTLQKFTSVHASIRNHFNHQRHLNRRDIFKQGRAAALHRVASPCSLIVLDRMFFGSSLISRTMPQRRSARGRRSGTERVVTPDARTKLAIATM